MFLPRGRQSDAVPPWRDRRLDDAAAIGRVERKDVLERGIAEPLALEAAGAEHEQAAAALPHERAGHRQLLAGQQIRIDVGEDDDVVGEEAVTRVGIAAEERVGARRRRLDVERLGAGIVAALARNRIHFETAVGGPGAAEEAVLEARRPLDEEDAARPARGRHERAPRVVLGDELVGGGRNLHGVDGRHVAIGRHVEGLADRRAVDRGCDAAQIDGTAVLEKPQLDRRAAVAMRHGGHRHIDHGVAQHRLRRRDADDLAIFRWVRAPMPIA